MTRARDTTRDRLRSSLLLAVLLHALAFVALEIFLKLAPQRAPEYHGPLVVQLQELPAVQQARQAAPAAAPVAAAPGQAGAGAASSAAAPGAGAVVSRAEPAVAAATEAQLPSGPPLRAAAPAGPGAQAAASPFRMEGAPAQAGQPRPAGQGFQVPSPEPTLPPAGTQAQGPPLRAVAPGSGGQAAPAVPLEEVDRALASGSAARAGGGSGAGAPGAAGAPGGAQAGAGRGEVSQEGISIVFDDPTLGREPTYHPNPVIPKWVSEAGLRLTQEISFVLTPQGVLHSVRTIKSSGYSDVDSAVLDAVRRWKFKPAPAGAGTIQGTVGFDLVLLIR
jgi:TonB family protein